KSSFESSIHVYRAMARMTQQDLANRVGVSRQTIIQLERNKYNQKNCLVKYSLYCLGFLFYIVIQCFFEGEHIINGYAKDVR
ncbi:helix-turn-helix transcriptional regulator, partial [Enterococcus faecalis]|uniref:helix-turn-helix transcriptional regulator n=1 Tax=Enterococcus faecalis TaxID=1351 RepID=UPI0020B89C5B